MQGYSSQKVIQRKQQLHYTSKNRGSQGMLCYGVDQCSQIKCEAMKEEGPRASREGQKQNTNHQSTLNGTIKRFNTLIV